MLYVALAVLLIIGYFSIQGYREDEIPEERSVPLNGTAIETVEIDSATEIPDKFKRCSSTKDCTFTPCGGARNDSEFECDKTVSQSFKDKYTSVCIKGECKLAEDPN